MNWTTDEIRYLEEHQGEGAMAIAEALGRTVISVQVQACRYGISLVPRWRCPKCGAVTRKPLSSITGWCANCTKEARRDRIAEEVREPREAGAVLEEAPHEEKARINEKRMKTSR